MPHVSDERKRHEPTIRQLASKGMSIRAIARQLGVNRGVVQRVLESDSPASVAPIPADAPADYDEVNAEYEELYDAARADGSVDALRRVFTVAQTCRANGYDVEYHALPLIMALSASQVDASAADRAALRKEIRDIYAVIKPAA